MGKLIAGMASSHAYAVVHPTGWAAMRKRTYANYKRRYGTEPPVHPKVAEETLEDNQARYRRISSGFDFFKETLKEKKPDALILIGDDQDENFTDQNIPQFALYVGDEVYSTYRDEAGARKRGPQYRCHGELSRKLLDGLVEREFDVASCRSFPNSELLSHAHSQILNLLDPQATIPLVIVFVNAIHCPGPSPARCYALGRAVREIVESSPGNERFAIYGSGGLSHFTAGYPWEDYQGPLTLGSISEEFDRKALGLMGEGKGAELAQLTSKDLLDNGDIEMRSWIILVGAMAETPARVLAYEPFYSGVMGMGMAYWELENGR